jgi:hypothetical protein
MNVKYHQNDNRNYVCIQVAADRVSELNDRHEHNKV